MLNVIEKEFDVVVVGSGGAGGAAASEAAKNGARVLVVSKDPLVCSDSKISGGIITVRKSGAQDDSEHNLATNMRIEGSDIGDPTLLQTFAKESISAYGWLQRWGQRAEINELNGNPVSFTVGGHNRPRTVFSEQGGLDFGHTIWNAILQGENQITCLEDAWCLEVITDKGPSRQVVGCLVYHAASGEFWRVRTPSVVLACGGLSTLYFPNTDTMRGNTGDGYAIAARLGCELVDMEQVQFIPFATTRPKSFQGLMFGDPASAGPLGVLRDRDGKILMTGVSRRNRAEVAAAIGLAVQQGRGTEDGGCYLDLTHNVEGAAGKLFYELFSALDRGHGFLDIVRKTQGPKAAEMKEFWEVRPSAHYCMGGVRVNADGESIGKGSVKGLLAAGQVLGGLHGGNRLGSTSLTETVIFGRRAGRKAADLAVEAQGNSQQFSLEKWQHEAQRLEQNYQNLLEQKGKLTASELTQRLQKVAWKYFGPVRSIQGLQQGLAELSRIRTQLSRVRISNDSPWNQSLVDYVELDNLLTTAEMIGTCALQRDTSTGAHVRIDSPRGQLLNRRPYSLLIRHDVHTQTSSNFLDWQIERLSRKPTSVWIYMAHKTSKQIALLFLAGLRHLPQKRLDPILTKKYRKMAIEMGVKLTTDVPPGTKFESEVDSTIALRLKKRFAQTADAVTFQFEADKANTINFLSGQFGNFIFNIDDKPVMRSYSFSSAPPRGPVYTETLDITIKREPGGLVSNWVIDNLFEGQTVRMKQPQGKFCLPAHGASRPPKKILLVGAGSGITPLISMLNWLVDSKENVDVVLINSVRTEGDIMFADYISKLGLNHNNIRTYINYTGKDALLPENQNGNVAAGRLNTNLVRKWVPDLTERHVYVCGPSAFMENVQLISTELGLAKRKLHLENFSAQVDLSAFADLNSFKVEFSRSAVIADSVPGASLLDLAEQENLDTNFSCRSGTCGECKTRLVSGEVHMVSEDGLDARDKLNGHILTCTAVPLSNCQLEA